MTLGDRVVVMKDGWIQQVGEPLDLYAKPANRFVAGFIGSPAMNFVEVKLAEAGGNLWAEAPGLRLAVPPSRASQLKTHKGQGVTFGIRPEDVRLATSADPEQYAFQATVEVVEPLGAEILLDVHAGQNALVARVDPTTRAKVHDTLRLAINAERVHFFDAKSELAI